MPPPIRLRFNSRTREGCDIRSISAVFVLRSFNSRTREGCDLRVISRRSLSVEFQFTHPGGVRLSSFPLSYICCVVSIHAPGRGATNFSPLELVAVRLFQFTHPGGVRPQTARIAVFVSMFQFTHPGGVRLEFSAPRDLIPRFQFTHPGGVRHITQVGDMIDMAFQFTHPGGVRRAPA